MRPTLMSVWLHVLYIFVPMFFHACLHVCECVRVSAWGFGTEVSLWEGWVVLQIFLLPAAGTSLQTVLSVGSHLCPLICTEQWLPRSHSTLNQTDTCLYTLTLSHTIHICITVLVRNTFNFIHSLAAASFMTEWLYWFGRKGKHLKKMCYCLLEHEHGV